MSGSEMMQIDINFPNGSSDFIIVHFGDDPTYLAEIFRQKHGLKESSVAMISKHISETILDFQQKHPEVLIEYQKKLSAEQELNGDSDEIEDNDDNDTNSLFSFPDHTQLNRDDSSHSLLSQISTNSSFSQSTSATIPSPLHSRNPSPPPSSHNSINILSDSQPNTSFNNLPTSDINSINVSRNSSQSSFGGTSHHNQVTRTRSLSNNSQFNHPLSPPHLPNNSDILSRGLSSNVSQLSTPQRSRSPSKASLLSRNTSISSLQERDQGLQRGDLEDNSVYSYVTTPTSSPTSSPETSTNKITSYGKDSSGESILKDQEILVENIQEFLESEEKEINNLKMNKKQLSSSSSSAAATSLSYLNSSTNYTSNYETDEESLQDSERFRKLNYRVSTGSCEGLLNSLRTLQVDSEEEKASHHSLNENKQEDQFDEDEMNYNLLKNSRKSLTKNNLKVASKVLNVTKPGENMKKLNRSSSILSDLDGDHHRESLFKKNAHERLYYTSVINNKKIALKKKTMEENEKNFIKNNQFKLNSVSKKITDSLHSAEYYEEDIGSRLYDDALRNREKKISKILEDKEKKEKTLGIKDWSCKKCGSFHPIKWENTIISSISSPFFSHSSFSSFNNSNNSVNSAADSQDFSLGQSIVLENNNQKEFICDKCDWRTNKIELFKPRLDENEELAEFLKERKRMQLIYSEEIENNMRGPYDDGKDSYTGGTIHNYLYYSNKRQDNMIQLNQELFNDLNQKLVFKPQLPTGSIAIINKYKKENKKEEEENDDNFSIRSNLTTSTMNDKNNPKSSYSTFSIQEKNDFLPPKARLSGNNLKNYLQKSTTERLVNTKTLSQKIGDSYNDKNNKKSKKSLIIEPKQEEFVKRLSYEYKEKDEKLLKKQQKYHEYDISTGKKLYQPTISDPNDKYAPTSLYKSIKTTNNLPIWEDILRRDKEMLEKKERIQQNAVLESLKAIQDSQFKALKSSTDILNQSTRKHLEDLFKLLLASLDCEEIYKEEDEENKNLENRINLNNCGEEYMEENYLNLNDTELDEAYLSNPSPNNQRSYEERYRDIHRIASNLTNWETREVDLMKIDANLVINEVSTLLIDVKTLKFLEWEKKKKSSEGLDSETIAPLSINFEEFYKLSILSMQQRSGPGKSYVFIPRKKSYGLNLKEEEEKEETFHPTINKTSEEIIARNRQVYISNGVVMNGRNRKAIEEILLEDAEKRKEKLKEAIEHKVKQEKNLYTFKPKLYKLPKGVIPRYRGIDLSSDDLEDDSTVATEKKDAIKEVNIAGNNFQLINGKIVLSSTSNPNSKISIPSANSNTNSNSNSNMNTDLSHTPNVSSTYQSAYNPSSENSIRTENRDINNLNKDLDNNLYFEPNYDNNININNNNNNNNNQEESSQEPDAHSMSLNSYSIFNKSSEDKDGEESSIKGEREQILQYSNVNSEGVTPNNNYVNFNYQNLDHFLPEEHLENASHHTIDSMATISTKFSQDYEENGMNSLNKEGTFNRIIINNIEEIKEGNNYNYYNNFNNNENLRRHEQHLQRIARNQAYSASLPPPPPVASSSSSYNNSPTTVSTKNNNISNFHSSADYSIKSLPSSTASLASKKSQASSLSFRSSQKNTVSTSGSTSRSKPPPLPCDILKSSKK